MSLANERSVLAPTRECVEQGFWEIVTDIECPKDVKIAALSALDSAILTGDPKLEVQAIINTIGQTDWHWHWFDKWAVRFNEMQEWPYLWKSLRLCHTLTSSDGIASKNFSMCELLTNTILHKIYTTSRVRDYLVLQADGLANRELSLAFAGCPIEEGIIQALNPNIIDGDTPPFFPGDRTRLRTKRKTH